MYPLPSQSRMEPGRRRPVFEPRGEGTPTPCRTRPCGYEIAQMAMADELRRLAMKSDSGEESAQAPRTGLPALQHAYFTCSMPRMMRWWPGNEHTYGSSPGDPGAIKSRTSSFTSSRSFVCQMMSLLSTARDLLSRPPRRKRSDRRSASRREGVCSHPRHKRMQRRHGLPHPACDHRRRIVHDVDPHDARLALRVWRFRGAELRTEQ